MSMRGARRQRREAIAEALANIECPSCGRIFEGQAAYVIGHDGRCLPDSAYGQLAEVKKDGLLVWSERWRHPEISRR